MDEQDAIPNNPPIIPPPPSSAAAEEREENRDDSETVALFDSEELRTAVAAANNNDVNDNGEQKMMMMDVDGNDNDHDDNANDNAVDLNATRFDDDNGNDEEDKLDLNSVLSGTTEEYQEDVEGVFGKNLGAMFDDAKGLEFESSNNNHQNQPTAAFAAAATNDGKQPPSAMMNAATNTKPPMGPNNASRPPLPPGRPGSASTAAAAAAFNKSNGQNPSRTSSTPNSTTTATTATGDDKRLTVFLRVRPPVCANGKKGNEGSINTVEVIKPAAGGAGGGLPTTIRTYPPLNSNAAKVVRGSNTRASARRCRVNNTNQSSNTSKSFNDDDENSTSSGVVDPTAEIRGVKEYSYSGVFAPDSTQSDVYTNVAAPLVEGLFPQATANNTNNNGDVYGELGESALLFTLGVTNAGKTHTVMGNTGLEPMKQKMTRQQQQQQKGTKAKKLTMKMMPKSVVKLGEDFKLNQDCGIIPRSLDHMLVKIKTLNDQAATQNNGQQCLQLYMSYLEIYNENIYDLLPNPSEEDNKPRRPCDSQPTLKLRESRRGKIFVRGLARHAVDNVQQGLELAHMAKMNRHTASNNINEESSRSHSICQLEIAYAPATRSGNAAAAAAGGGLKKSSSGNDTDVDSEFESDDESVCSKSSIGSSNSRLSNTTRQQQRKKSTIIWIVDLAGSERGKKTRAHTRHQKEAALINASLMNLMRCLREMLNHQPTKKRGGGSSKGGVVPFRDSKLSHMFMNHLTGPSASRTSMVVNVNPAADDYDETQHVLAYAATARSVTISAVDYNRSLRRFAKESKAKTTSASGTSTTKQALANIAKKLSPKKRKGGAATESKNPAAKRLRSNSHTSSASAASSLGSTKRFGNSATSSAARKPPPKFGGRSTRSGTTKGSTQELEQLREENFELKFTVDDLRQQLDDCETTTRNEVVEQMDEQLQDAKIWYENRIAKLQQEVNLRQSSSKQDGEQEGVAVGLSSSEAEEMQEQIAECEEEMKRMRDDHEEEVQKLSSEHLALVREHQVEIDNLNKEHKKQLAAEQSKAKHLENEVGMLRHQSTELQVSHASLLEKYNALLAAQKEQATVNTASAQQEKENPSVAAAAACESPSFHKLPRERVSDVASAAGCVDIVSPSKKKRGKWFVKSPAKVDIGAEKKSPIRSPLGKINKK